MITSAASDEERASENARPLAIFDIDGVLADVSHRLHFVAKRPKDWIGFFAAAEADPLLSEGYDLARQLADTHETLYLTGRPESNRKLTGAWLVQHDLPRGRLLMRPDRDYRPARKYKVETLHRLNKQHEIGVIVDDDPAVVEALEMAGFPVRLATWLPYAKPLAVAQEQDGRT